VGRATKPAGSAPLLLSSSNHENTQAEQFFDEEEDPTDHRAMWNSSGNHEI